MRLAMPRRYLPGALILLGLIPGVLLADEPGVSGGLWTTSVAWQFDAGRTSQLQSGAWAEIPLRWGFNAHVTADASRAKGAGATLEFADGLGGGFLLRYQPPRQTWLVQVGAGLPAGPRELTDDERELVGQLGAPALGFADPQAVRGWALHLGALSGFALSRELSLHVGGGYAVAARLEPNEGLSLEPGDRIAILAGVDWTGSRYQGAAQAALGHEGAERAADVVVREGRSLMTLGLSGAASGERIRLSLAARLATSGATEWTAFGPDSAATARPAGPGLLTEITLQLAASAGLRLGEAWRLVPVLSWTYCRFQPRDLPVGEARATVFSPQLRWVGPGPQIIVGVGLGRGKRRAGSPADAAHEEIDGVQARLELAWNARAARAAQASGGR